MPPLVEYEVTQKVWVEFREGVATFVFGLKEHRRVVVPADIYLGFLEDLLAKAHAAKDSRS